MFLRGKAFSPFPEGANSQTQRNLKVVPLRLGDRAADLDSSDLGPRRLGSDAIEPLLERIVIAALAYLRFGSVRDGVSFSNT